MKLSRSRNILIIVDNLTDCQTYQRYLLQDPKCQYNVLEAATGKAGLALCDREAAALQHRIWFDAIVVDFPLPDLDSLEFFTHLKRQAKRLSYNTLPVILLVKSESKVVAMQAIELGVQDYIIKEEINREVFLSTVSGAIANFRTRNGQLNNRCFVPLSNGTGKKQELEISEEHTTKQHTSLLNVVNETILELDRETYKYRQIKTNLANTRSILQSVNQQDSVFQALADNVLHMFWVTRPDGYHEYFNKRWYEYTGMTPEQSHGWGWSHLLHPDDRERCLEIWNESLRTGKNYIIEYRFQRASDGQYRWFLGQAFPLRDPSGQIIRWFGSCTDIHEQKCAQEERDLALERERLAREQAEMANSLKDEFLAILSHELRSPLNPILGWTQLLQNRQLNEAQTKQALASIERNAKLQTQLIDDLLDMARILRGKLALNLVPVNLVFAIETALETVRKAADDKSIAIETNLEDIGEVLGDTARIQQIIWNLLSNAIKFTPKGGRVEIQLQRHNHFAQITVSDTGKGIPAEFLPHIFEYFRQGDASTTRQYGGLGLGLAIVHHLASIHGGTVTAMSLGEGKGATFTVKLPLLKDKIITIDEANKLPDRKTDLTGKRILLVDDEVDSRQFIAFLLEQYGAEVMAVTGTAEALVALTSFKLDVLVSDIAMPVEDGYSLLRRVRSLPPEEGGQIPAIALTAYAREEDRQKCFAVGYQHHLAKPINSSALLAAISLLTNKH
jgi:PAS domain S-box-containing protein